MKRKNIYITTLLIAAILVAVNLISDQLFYRLDLTEDHSYTLSNATKDILKNLQEPVTVTAYFSKDLPPSIGQTRDDFKDMLIEYTNRAKGMLVYEFLNPNQEKTAEQEALQNGIQPVMINVRDKDQMKQQKAYMGAVVSMGDRKEVIPFVQPGGAMEYALSSAIKKLSVVNKPRVGILQGYGMPALSELVQAVQSLGVLYDVQAVTITDTTGIPDDMKTVALIRPTDSIPGFVFDELDRFMARGGNLLVAVNRVKGDFQTAYGSAVSTGTESWLLKKGIRIKDAFVLDVNCGSVTVQQKQGFFNFQTNINFPYLPVISNFADHPATTGLEAVVLQFASPIEYTGDSTRIFKPLAFTSEQSGEQRPPLYFDIQRQWKESDFPEKNLVVMAELSGNPAGSGSSRMIVISDGDFPIGNAQQQVSPDNVNLLVNSIDYLSDDTGLITLRNRGITARPLKQLSDSKKTFLKFLNFLLPIVLALLYGFYRMQRNRNIRMRRMEENYTQV